MDAILVLFSTPEAWIALATLITMELVLGIDNLLFITILSNKLPEGDRDRARRIGIALALVLRLGLLAGIAWIVGLTAEVISAFGHGFSWRDLIMIGGGLFLVWKATSEIHHHVDPDSHAEDKSAGIADAAPAFAAVITQILMLDLIFSIDSIITAVGMTPHLPIMVIAVVVAVTAMLVAAGPLGRFVEGNPTVVMLALGFLLAIGVTLIAEGFGAHVPKGYIYAAMAFSAFVEGLNMMRRRAKRAKS